MRHRGGRGRADAAQGESGVGSKLLIVRINENARQVGHGGKSIRADVLDDLSGEASQIAVAPANGIEKHGYSRGGFGTTYVAERERGVAPGIDVGLAERPLQYGNRRLVFGADQFHEHTDRGLS